MQGSIKECLWCSVIFFNCISFKLARLLKGDLRISVYHLINSVNQPSFLSVHSETSQDINLDDFPIFPEYIKLEQVKCEEIVNKIKQANLRQSRQNKVHLQLIKSKHLKSYFSAYPEQQLKNEDSDLSINRYNPRKGILPNYFLNYSNKSGDSFQS